MKKFVFGTCLLFTGSFFAQNIGINTDGSIPTKMLDVKTSTTASSDGIRINNPNTGSGDAILNFQNEGTDVWTLGFDDSDGDKFKIGNAGDAVSTNTRLTIESDGQTGINTTAPNTRFHVNGASGEDVFRLQTNGSTKMFMASNGQISMGAFFTPDDQLDVRGNVQIDQGYLRVGAATATATTRYGTWEMNWDEAFNFNSSSDQYRSVGTFDAYSKHGNTNITITGIEWSLDAFHQDGNEDPIAFYITLNTDNSNSAGTIGWKGWYGNGTSGARDIDWNYVDNDLSTTVTQDMYIKLRALDQDIAFDGDDRFYINNLTIKIHYTYSQALQSGDIAATGEVYAQNVYSMNTTGDVAERFEIDPNTAVGTIVAQVPGENNKYKVADFETQPYLIGVVSPNPSVVLNEAGYGAKIGLVGRVDVQLAKDSPLIKAGDPITVSKSEPGKGSLATSNCYLIGRATTNQKEGESSVQIYLTPGAMHVQGFMDATLDIEENGKEGNEFFKNDPEKTNKKGVRTMD